MDCGTKVKRAATRRATWIGSATLLICAACAKVTETGPSEFTVRVDSVLGPTAVSGGIAAEQQLWGTVGPNGCTILKEIRTSRVPSKLDVTVIGERTGTPCIAGTVALDGVAVRIEPIIPEDFSFVVHQPDGSTLVRRIVGE